MVPTSDVFRCYHYIEISRVADIVGLEDVIRTIIESVWQFALASENKLNDLRSCTAV